ncbi:PACE efflux transporter [Pasteurellaceae bacterium LIM206]|nr:PACE efflux transporter [Pasteurellaceae bacterium LIM206]
MNFKERFFHSVLFEFGALCVAGLAVSVTTQTALHTAFGVSLIMAVMAMTLNFVFNYLFDKVFTGKREKRGLLFRIFHTTSFEATLLLFTVPLIAYVLQISWWQAFLMDVSLTLIIMLYALIFNWAYDHLRLRWVAADSI